MDSETPQTPPRDYKDTLRLPQTAFPMRAGLPKREPGFLQFWQDIGLYARLREDANGREKFILHDGPPYANGNLHIGHALNKVLKDVINRSQQMMGKDAPYIPGWDCHGLPIEWKIEEDYRNRGMDKESIPMDEFRTTCREFATHWVEIQKAQFQRLGVLGDWDAPYLTMTFDAEAQIVAEFLKFAMDGSLYRGSKPVMWSVVEKTALAEAEIEYEEHVSPTIFVRFPIARLKDGLDASQAQALAQADIVIWTTTPWTIPGNRACAYSPKLSYGLYQTPLGALVLADALAERVMAAAEIEGFTRLFEVNPATIDACAHPFADAGYDFDIPLLPADFVTDDTGTGLVHIAPGHGPDDFELGMTHGIEVPFTIDADGSYLDTVPLVGGARILNDKGKAGDANPRVIEALKTRSKLLAQGKLRHQYPHSWRSKAPLIFRNTPQWFISMEIKNLREKALNALEQVDFVPPSGRNRIESMVATRPDWVVSRQRAWGVPLTIFVDKQTNEILRDASVNQRIHAAISAQGADAWYQINPQEFLGDAYNADDYDQITDILDVWFDSGATHAFVLEQRDGQQSPADVYLEGSDQHRGWFQSSLLESCGTRGCAPYKTLITHGFVMDESGRKMSKSAENATAPQKIIAQAGGDILRLWVMSSDYTEDLRFGNEILKANTEAYRKMRNSLRFLLGNIEEDNNPPPYQALPELEQYILYRLTQIDTLVREGYQQYDFRKAYTAIFGFMTQDLSAFYFDIRKDALYCDSPASTTRRACQFVLDRLFYCLTCWLAPMLPFTMEEVWQARFETAKTHGESVHLQQFPKLDPRWHEAAQNANLETKWRDVRNIRRVVTGALERERQQGTIGSSLEAAPQIYIDEAALHKQLDGLDMAEICITSQIEIIAAPAPDGAFTLDDVANVHVISKLAQGKKCQRSWKIANDIGSDTDYPDLSPRDARAVREYDAKL